MSFYLAIISPLDSPLYELSFPSSRQPLSTSATENLSSSNKGLPSWSSFTGTGTGGGGESSMSRPGSIGGIGGLGSGGGAAAAGGGTGGGAGAGAGGGAGGAGGGGGTEKALFQMIAFKSLDGVEEVMESTGSLYLRNVDKHNEWSVSAYLAMGVKFVLVHDQKNDDGIRQFFLDIWELWVKVLLNPFHTVNTPIRNMTFESRVRAAAKRYL